MGVGKVLTATLTDIANAIRSQNGTSSLYKPSEMAAAVAALDGESAGAAGTEAYKDAEWGFVDEASLTAIADAIRGQNGAEAKYRPSEMAAAILALSWAKALAPRAVLCEDGTLELNCVAGVRCGATSAKVVSSWELAAPGYSSASDCPWYGSADSVARVVFDSTWAEAGFTCYEHWFSYYANLAEVSGFENVSAGSLDYMFTGCEKLESVFASGYDASGITSATVAFYGCYRLVGAQGFVPCSASGVKTLSYGETGALTDPAADAREWAWWRLYADGSFVLGPGADGDGRAVADSGRVCLTAAFETTACVPWYSHAAEVKGVSVAAGACGSGVVRMDYWFRDFSSCSTFDGLANLSRVAEMYQTFCGCSSVARFDLRGFSPSELSSVHYTFKDCAALTTILADPTWALPDDCKGAGTFDGCDLLVGGAGSACKGSYMTGAMRMRIDGGTDAPGYLTAG